MERSRFDEQNLDHQQGYRKSSGKRTRSGIRTLRRRSAPSRLIPTMPWRIQSMLKF